MNDFEHYIQIKTDSQPRGARSVALTGLASRRQIELKFDSTLDQVTQIIKEHYIQSDGKIELFGNITGYHWMILETTKMVVSKQFDVNGEFIKDSIIFDEV